MNDDIHTDEHFYMKQCDDKRWRLYDGGEETCCKETMQEMVAFVHGLWRGMSIITPVEATCAVFNVYGTNIDTLTSVDLLAA